MGIVISLVVLIGLLLLGFIAWLTGFSSFLAIVAGVLLLVCGGLMGAKMAGIVSLPDLFLKIGGWVVALCLVVIIWAWASHKTQTQADFQKDGIVPSVGKVVGKAVWQTAFGEPKPTPTTPPSTHNTTAVSPQPPSPCQGPWDVRELDIPAGGLPVQLCWGWSFWSINGPVTLTTKSGKPYKFLPGKEGEVVIQELQMGGVAIFRADPDGSARRIAVKNRW